MRSSEKPETVLVLDNDATSRFVLERVVRDLGLTPVSAVTIAEAKQQAAQQVFACALIDKNLDGESGLDFLGWLRAAQPGCSAVMVTGYGSVESTVEALRLGAADFVLKPFEIDLIAHRLKLLLERQRLLKDTEAANQRLVAADRLVVLGTLSAGIVHDVANPLTFLGMGLDMLEADLRTVLTPAAVHTFGELRKKVAHIGAVISNVQTFSRHDTDDLSALPLEPSLEAALSLADSVIKYRGCVVREWGPAPRVRATESRLTQVFLNLLVNAAQALPQPRAAASEIHVRLLTAADGGAQVEIIDNGAGITPELQARLFTPFVTTKPRGVGTGLGLWICRSVVEGLGGRLELESAVGRGTTVRVLLPGSP